MDRYVKKIKIFMAGVHTKATLLFDSEESMTIDWTNVAEREKVFTQMNGYTIIEDMRIK